MGLTVGIPIFSSRKYESKKENRLLWVELCPIKILMLKP